MTHLPPPPTTVGEITTGQAQRHPTTGPGYPTHRRFHSRPHRTSWETQRQYHAPAPSNDSRPVPNAVAKAPGERSTPAERKTQTWREPRIKAPSTTKKIQTRKHQTILKDIKRKKPSQLCSERSFFIIIIIIGYTRLTRSA